MPRAATSPELMATAERRLFVLDLRRKGRNYRDIAAEALRHFGPDRLPAGWDARYAYKDVARELEQVHGEIQEDAQAIKTLEIERLDSLWYVMYQKALAGDEKAVDRCIRIQERRAKLLGLDAPQRHELGGPDGAAVVIQMTWGDVDAGDG